MNRTNISDEEAFTEHIVKIWTDHGYTAANLDDRIPKVNNDNYKLSLNAEKINEIHSFQSDVDSIINLFTEGNFKGRTYKLLAELVDTFGARMTGSQALEDTIDWVLEEAKTQGFDEIYTEPVTAPHWVRNSESLFMVTPRLQQLPMLGLGTSVGTPEEGIQAEVIVVESFDELQTKSNLIPGKIVVFNAPFVSYAKNIHYRLYGASAAAKLGAVAALIRSVTDFSINSPHTGVQFYQEGAPKIPAAAITIDDANMLDRMAKKGTEMVLHLKMEAENLPDFQSRNTVLEVVGSESPEEVVLVSGHLDSWDIGTGAMDDAGGCVISWLTGHAVKELNLSPRRTMRTVMFTGEEQGIYGGEAYFRAHNKERHNFQFMMECDYGLFGPEGLEVSGNEEAISIIKEVLSLTAKLGTTLVASPAETPDLDPFAFVGVPRGSLKSDISKYLWFHHTHGDTIEVYDDPEMLDKVTALWASVSYVLASINFRIPHQEHV